MADPSIVDYLNSKGQDSSYSARAKLAAQLGIQNYTGTAAQNTQLLQELQTQSSSQPNQQTLQQIQQQLNTIQQQANTIQQSQQKTTSTTNPTSTNNTQTNAQKASQIQSQIATLQGQVQAAKNAGITDPNAPIPQSVLDSANKKTPATTPQSFSAVTGYQTGNAQLDAIVAGLQNYLNGLIASGQKINPNIALSPNDVQIFLNQAKSEDDPDFARQIESVQTATSQNLTALQTQYEAEQTKENIAFQQSLASTRDTNEKYGTMQSSARNFQELQATQTANANATLNASQAQNSAQKLASSEASQVGDENVNNLPQFQNYTYSNQGIGGATAGSNLNYFNIGNYPTGTGSIEQNQYTAENQDAITFGSNKLRSLSLGVYGGT